MTPVPTRRALLRELIKDMERPVAVTTRRATHLYVQRLSAAPASRIVPFPALCQGLRGPASIQLPALLGPTIAAASTAPSCVGCGVAVSWSDWAADAAVLHLGSGKFFARCAACQATDVLFKDGVSP